MHLSSNTGGGGAQQTLGLAGCFPAYLVNERLSQTPEEGCHLKLSSLHMHMYVHIVYTYVHTHTHTHTPTEVEKPNLPEFISRLESLCVCLTWTSRGEYYKTTYKLLTLSLWTTAR